MKKIFLLIFVLCATDYFAGDNRVLYLFNGKDLCGWQHVGEGQFVVVDGMIKTEGGIGLLWYKKEKFCNVNIKVVYKPINNSNSGVFIRIPETPTEPWMPVNKGFEVQIDDTGDEYHITGTLYSLTKAIHKAGVDNVWNVMEITLDGDRTIVKVNGLLVTDYKEGDAVPPKKKEWEPARGARPVGGYIGLQNHQPEDTVYFKEISVTLFHKKN